MKKTNIIIRLVVAIFLISTLFLFKGCYVREEIGTTLEFDSIDKGITYQFFYTTEASPNFSEENSVLIQSRENTSDFEHYEIVIPSEENIVDFRIDFGVSPGELKIKNITLIGENETIISLDDVVGGFNGDVESYELTNDYLQINSSKGDPMSIIKGVGSSPYKEKILNYSDLVDLVIIYFMSVGLVWYCYNKYSKKAKNKSQDKNRK